MTLRRLVLSLFLASAAACFGQADAGRWTLTGAVTSEYLFRGVRLGGLSFQPMAEYDRGPLAFGIWANTPVADKVPGQSDPEIDPYASYRVTLNDAVSLQPGVTWYTFPRAERRDGFYRSTVEPNLALNVVTHGVLLTPKVYYDVVLHGPTYELNASYALPWSSLGTELDLYGSVGTYTWHRATANAPTDVRGHGDYWSATAALPYQLGSYGRVTASVGYAEGWGNSFRSGAGFAARNPAAVGRVVLTLSYSRTF